MPRRFNAALAWRMRSLTPGRPRFSSCTDGVAASIEEALHTNLLVADVRQVSITGLGGGVYIDKTEDMSRKALAADPLRLNGTTDRVFLNTSATCTVTDPVLARRSIVEKTGSTTTAVWNPWHEKAS